MRYFKVKEYHDFPNGTVLVQNELLTSKEKGNYPDHWFEQVEVKKSDTYWFFGARFS